MIQPGSYQHMYGIDPVVAKRNLFNTNDLTTVKPPEPVAPPATIPMPAAEQVPTGMEGLGQQPDPPANAGSVNTPVQTSETGGSMVDSQGGGAGDFFKKFLKFIMHPIGSLENYTHGDEVYKHINDQRKLKHTSAARFQPELGAYMDLTPEQIDAGNLAGPGNVYQDLVDAYNPGDPNFQKFGMESELMDKRYGYESDSMDQKYGHQSALLKQEGEQAIQAAEAKAELLINNIIKMHNLNKEITPKAELMTKGQVGEFVGENYDDVDFPGGEPFIDKVLLRNTAEKSKEAVIVVATNVQQTTGRPIEEVWEAIKRVSDEVTLHQGFTRDMHGQPIPEDDRKKILRTLDFLRDPRFKDMVTESLRRSPSYGLTAPGGSYNTSSLIPGGPETGGVPPGAAQELYKRVIEFMLRGGGAY